MGQRQVKTRQNADSLRSTFVQESQGILLKCLRYLAELESTADRKARLHQLHLLSDNLCEPAMMVGMPEIFDLAVKFRENLMALRKELNFDPVLLQKMGRQCQVMQSLLAAASGGVKLSAKDILAHDLKSPLGIIKVTVENLLLVTNEENAEPLQRVLRQANKGLQLLQHWLQDQARENAQAERQTLAVIDVINECCESFQIQAHEKHIHILMAVDKALMVRAHALYLSQILHNLLGNAIKFSLPGGRIEISAQKSTLPGTQRPAVLFHVADQGRGIDDQDVPYLFLQRVQAQAQDRLHGSGLGLAICKELCEWHGGTIWVRSQPQQGSTFSFVIPET